MSKRITLISLVIFLISAISIVLIGPSGNEALISSLKTLYNVSFIVFLYFLIFNKDSDNIKDIVFIIIDLNFILLALFYFVLDVGDYFLSLLKNLGSNVDKLANLSTIENLLFILISIFYVIGFLYVILGISNVIFSFSEFFLGFKQRMIEFRLKSKFKDIDNEKLKEFLENYYKAKSDIEKMSELLTALKDNFEQLKNNR